MKAFRDAVETGEDGLIDTLNVMVRTLSAATALSEAMGAQFGQIQTEAAEIPEGLR